MNHIESNTLHDGKKLASTHSLSGLSVKEICSVPVWFFATLCVIVGSAAWFGTLPKNMIGGLAIIMSLGFILSTVGKNIPLIKDIGGPAIFCLMIPSILVFYHVIPKNVLDSVHVLMKDANFLYFVIATLVVGSILGMNRIILVQGMIRMFVPLVVGTLTAVGVGLVVGKAVGYSFYHTFFYIIVPIIGGGIGEGILPLSLAYSSILGTTPDIYVAQLVPAAVIGNIFAIVCAGFLSKLGKMKPELSGNGMLIRTAEDNAIFNNIGDEGNGKTDYSLMGAGLLMICCFFIFGGLLERLVHIPGPVLMIVMAVLCKYAKVIPGRMETGAKSCYKLISTSLIWPTMIGLGMLYVPLESVVSVFSVAYVAVCASVVLSMAIVSFLLARFLNMYSVEASIVTVCHSGLGGTGDVAILSACDRMGLMPFAQISTRIGGASTVILATMLLAAFS
ncbi:2-hydroxycarboxylate transporter family protein [Atlantibacter hermannii]|uniref:2-hydroxycarboxylate transporter family protein n=1 Tax=Atlantibacter hermannii TaxID=565 RepID=UPI0019336DDD|nr:2-hydroxycarboxylate transporter family protein [Atlantibacter hermannii]MBL7635968.1 2-hydroxycarboxylate transporter family protein [Atlantibacter hermannii]MBL7676660.1 2-hydroxycarboxylate transporter family protein [Atlantibacter hermannii]MCZ7836639.1 2-hydroxycarboxylate transporter family protein [Atlantibacter hermannii]